VSYSPIVHSSARYVDNKIDTDGVACILLTVTSLDLTRPYLVGACGFVEGNP